MSDHTPKPFPLEGTVPGLSDSQISQHRDVLYAGYVKKLNEIETALKDADRTAANGVYSAFREMKIEETFALNGVVLHELYFGNLGQQSTEPGEATKRLIERDFGTMDAWREDFLACGKAARGWVLFAYSLYDGKLHNYVLDTHHFHVPVLAIPLLVLDVYEHAYFIDFGTKRPEYLDVFMKNVRWDAVEKRLAWAEPLGAAEEQLV